MTLIGVILALIVIGFALWLINSMTMDSKVKAIINFIIIIAVCIWLLGVFGIVNIGSIRLR